MLKRREYLVNLFDTDDPLNTKRKEVKSGKGNLYSSQLQGQEYHCPTLDIDLECELHESTTPGHFHLYIDKPMRWDRYKDLLDVLYDLDIIQQGFYEMSLERKATFLRKPGVKKQEGEVGDS